MPDERVEANQLLDHFTSVDEKVDELSTEVSDQTDVLQGMANGISAIAQELGTEVDVGAGSEFPFEMSTTVPTSATRQNPHEVTIEIPFDATITSVHIGFPAGTQQAVGVQLGTAIGERWIPRGGVEQSGSGDDAQYIAFSDHVIQIDLGIDVDADNPITARFVNNDSANDHFINVLVLARERV